MVELEQETTFCGFAAFAVPGPVLLDLGKCVLEKFETHYRSARCK